MNGLAEGLKKYRESQGLNQAAMAKLLHIGYRTYQDIEKTGLVKKIKDLNSINKILSAREVTQIFSRANLVKEEDKLSDTASRFLIMLESQQRVIENLSEKVPRLPDINEATKNGSPPMKAITPK